MFACRVVPMVFVVFVVITAIAVSTLVAICITAVAMAVGENFVEER